MADTHRRGCQDGEERDGKAPQSKFEASQGNDIGRCGIELTHLDIFTGLGGFTLAAHWAGFRTIGMCEIDKRCQTFLEKVWGIPVWPNVDTLDGRKYRGVSLLTGGPPCQPASRAGKRQGARDDRWKWPSTLRVLEEAEPDSFVFENPPGIYDVGIDGILSEMGRLGYEVQLFDIPACSVDSPQLRYRVWFVGFRMADTDQGGLQKRRAESGSSDEKRNCTHKSDEISQSGGISSVGDTASIRAPAEEQSGQLQEHGTAVKGSHRSVADNRRERSGQDEQERRSQGRDADGRHCANDLADGAIARSQRPDAEPGEAGCLAECSQTGVMEHTEREREHGRSLSARGTRGTFTGVDRPTTSQWQRFVWVPCADDKFRRAPDESLDVVNGLHRSVLAALGNAICPELGYQILKDVREILIQ